MKKYDVNSVQAIPGICDLLTRTFAPGSEIDIQKMIDCGVHITEKLVVMQLANAVPGEFIQEFLEWVNVPEEPSMADAVTKKWRAYAETLPHDETRKESARVFFLEIENKVRQLIEKYKEQL